MHADSPNAVVTEPVGHAVHVSLVLSLYSPASQATQASPVAVGS